jgi:hypothetical protein
MNLFTEIQLQRANALLDSLNEDLKLKEQYKPIGVFTKNGFDVYICGNSDKYILFNVLDFDGNFPNGFSNFDFTITKFSLYSFEENQETMFNVVFVDTFFEDLSTNKLVIDDKLLFPVSTFERSYRYRDYGFGLCKESKSKLLEALKTANTDDLSNDLYFGID